MSTIKVAEGRIDDVKKYYKKVLDIVAASEPQLIAFHGFLSADETEMTSTQVHPNSASMEFHMQVLKGKWDQSCNQYGELLEAISIAHYGTPPRTAVDFDTGSTYPTDSWLSNPV